MMPPDHVTHGRAPRPRDRPPVPARRAAAGPCPRSALSFSLQPRDHACAPWRRTGARPAWAQTLCPHVCACLTPRPECVCVGRPNPSAQQLPARACRVSSLSAASSPASGVPFCSTMPAAPSGPAPASASGSAPDPPATQDVYETPYGTLRPASAEQISALGFRYPDDDSKELSPAADHQRSHDGPSGIGSQQGHPAVPDSEPVPTPAPVESAPQPPPTSDGDAVSVGAPDETATQAPSADDVASTAGPEEEEDDDDADDDEDKSASRRPITMAFIEDDTKRHIAFSKRKWGLMKKVRSFAIQRPRHGFPCFIRFTAVRATTAAFRLLLSAKLGSSCACAARLVEACGE